MRISMLLAKDIFKNLSGLSPEISFIRGLQLPMRARSVMLAFKLVVSAGTAQVGSWGGNGRIDQGPGTGCMQERAPLVRPGRRTLNASQFQTRSGVYGHLRMQA